ncbi:MAG: right-handed parallel beta-helix repeat-containing protein, partial [Candidatus Hodarchaeales archaeon]
VHDPIVISNDSDLATVANSGTGTVNDPYIIADWNITGSIGHGIYITGTTNHFRIENCLIVNSTKRGSSGIYVDNVTSGTTTITNNTCNDNAWGIYLRDSNSSTIANNICNSNNGYGIYIENSASSTVVNNTCNSNRNNGISLRDSGSSTVVNNTCNNNSDDGINLSFSDYSTVANNICSSNDGRGIYLVRSGSSTIANNTFFDDGLNFGPSSKEQLFSARVENNTVNELPLGYFENKTDSTINGAYGQLILVNCNNTMDRNSSVLLL